MVAMLLLVAALVVVGANAYDHRRYNTDEDPEFKSDSSSFSEFSVEQAEKKLLQHKIEASLARARLLALKSAEAAETERATGAFYALATSRTEAAESQLWRIDASAGSATSVGSGLGALRDTNALAFDGLTQRLYTIGRRARGNALVVAAVDARTGSAEQYCDVQLPADDDAVDIDTLRVASCTIDTEQRLCCLATAPAHMSPQTVALIVSLERRLTTLDGGLADGACPATAVLNPNVANNGQVDALGGVVATPSGTFVAVGAESGDEACDSSLQSFGAYAKADQGCVPDEADFAEPATVRISSAAFEPSNGLCYVLTHARSCNDDAEPCETSVALAKLSHDGKLTPVGAPIGVGAQALAIVPQV